MKRLSIILPILLCAASADAAAQWYMFDLNQEEKKEESVIETQVPDDGVLKLTLALPVKSKTPAPSANFLDMYSGSLMAVRDLADKNGIEIELNVIDYTDPDTPLSEPSLNHGNMVIGPVSMEDIEKALPLCNDGTVLISPLEPKSAALTNTGKIIQSPASWQVMVDEMILWLREETAPSNEVVVISDPSAEGMGEQTRYLLDALNWNAIHYKTLPSLSEKDILKSTEYKVIIASDSDKFITPTLKSLAALATKCPNITLFCTSRIRSSSGMNLNDLYSANARMAAPYHIDYNSDKVKRFILSYRALFNNEPSSFSFQGYDIVHYFATLYKNYGGEWVKRMSDYSEKGLQADFKFAPGGMSNTGARRVIYNRDLTTSLQQ